jgi:hypothetical protein
MVSFTSFAISLNSYAKLAAHIQLFLTFPYFHSHPRLAYGIHQRFSQLNNCIVSPTLLPQGRKNCALNLTSNQL